MNDTPIAHVTDTAFLVASYRAAESARPDALFHDPLAGLLAEARGDDIAGRLANGRQVEWIVIIRTCIIDAFLREAIAAGCDTVLNLGAGLDTRPYRLDLPSSLRWVEADFQATIAWKGERLAGETPRCRLERRAVDLTDGDARRALLADVAAHAGKAFVLTEGVIGYLANDAVAALADDLAAHPRFQWWALEYVSAQFRRIERMLSRRRLKQLENAPLQFDPADWRAFFADHGWTPREVRFFTPEGERLGRRPPVPLWMELAARVLSLNHPGVVRENYGFALMGHRPG